MRARPQPRYLLLAGGLGLLAVLRAAEGATVWAVLFTVAAVVNVGLAVAPAARPRRGAGDAAAGSTPAPDRAQARASGDLHARRARTWTVLTFACLATGALLVPLVPAFAVAAGALALVSLRAARRSRRSAGVLHAAAA